MKTRLFTRVIVGICFALMASMLAITIGEAREPLQDLEQPEQPEGEDCQSCHESISTHWEDSAHAQAVNDPVFQQAWKEQGSSPECLSCHTTGFDPATGEYDAEGVACATCHSPMPGNHPDEIMPTDISSRLCGDCHIDTHDEWQVSEHGQGHLTCVRCHNPHTTDLKAGGVQDLCATCHNEESHFFGFTAHAEEGLLCTDCHLRVSGDAEEMGEGHGRRLHSFAVDLESCTQCHGEEMHTDVATGTSSMGAPVRPVSGEGEQMAAPAVERAVINTEPAANSNSFGFAIPAALGLALGIILAPWLEQLYRRFREES